MINQLVQFIRHYYHDCEEIPLHTPIFVGNERNYVLDTLESTYVSSVGAYVNRFEEEMARYTKAERAVVTVNGTCALHMALILAGIEEGDYVITQALSFVATSNAIHYCQALPIFIDVDRSTLGLSPLAVDSWLEEHAFIDDQGQCRLRSSGKRVSACIPMHTFGHPVDLDPLIEVCKRWRLILIEDAAEALGSFYQDKHVGTFGFAGILSFNGNKIITSGGGGMILTNAELGKKAKHLTTTAKIPHPYEFYHDDIGYNYRLPNLNAALGCAQLEQLAFFLDAKRKLAQQYKELFNQSPYQFIVEPTNCQSNYWLNGVICETKQERDHILATTNKYKILTRPIWQTLNSLPMFKYSLCDALVNTAWLVDRVVNLPSSVRSAA